MPQIDSIFYPLDNQLSLDQLFQISMLRCKTANSLPSTVQPMTLIAMNSIPWFASFVPGIFFGKEENGRATFKQLVNEEEEEEEHCVF